MTDARWFSADWLDSKRLRPLVAPFLERVERALAHDRLPHALLLAGPAGLGRELLAVDIATRLVSPMSPDGEDSAEFDSAARRVRSGHHPDVVLVSGEGRKGVIRIAAIRRVVDEAPGRPFEGRHRVWILNGVDSGTFPAEPANAFLKVLEEPPEHVRFILLAANPQSVLATIRSRCSSLVLPGVVAASVFAATDSSIPPEIAGHVNDGSALTELVQAANRGLPMVLGGDRQAAISLATVMGAEKNGIEVVAAVALELAADPDLGELREHYAGLAAELIGSQRTISTFALRPDRQLLASFLKWGSGRGAV